MSTRWLTGLLASLLASNALVRAEDPLPLSAVSAILPQTPRQPPERPDELPNIDPRLDVAPLLRPPAGTPPPRVPLRERRAPSDYDPAYQYLPDRNPGLRQPPCPCLPLGRWWFDGGWFLGKTQNDSVPALVTTGGSGVANTNGVGILRGGDRLDQPFHSGVRVETGYWFDRCQSWGIDASFFYMVTGTTSLDSSSGNPLLARPFIAQPGNVPSSDVLAAPGNSGLVNINSPLSFLGTDVNSRHTLYCESHTRLDFLAGYRFVRMSERLNIHGHSETAGTIRDEEDDFGTLNYFHGGQIGLAGEYRFDRFYMTGSAKVAFGATWSTLDISGSTRTQTAGVSTTTAEGLLARSTNSGTFNDRRYAVVPEANFNFGYQIFDNWRAYLGYTFVYVSSVARPGQAIDTSIGTTAAGVVHPLRNDPSTSFWMHGINVGIEARY